jgi:hypothetical protein
LSLEAFSSAHSLILLQDSSNERSKASPKDSFNSAKERGFWY